MRRNAASSSTPPESSSAGSKARLRCPPTGGLHRLMARQFSPSSSTSFPITVRPEARRAYEIEAMDPSPQQQHSADGDSHDQDYKSGISGDASADSTRLLQQAANYAALAIVPPAVCAIAPSSLSLASATSGTRLAPPLSVASSAVPRLDIHTTSAYRGQARASIAACESSDPPSENNTLTSTSSRDVTDGEGDRWYSAPRLSMSSTASSGASEAKTPESINTDLNWQMYYAAGEAADELDLNSDRWDMANVATSAKQSAASRVPQSPGLIDMGDAMRDPEGLSDVGFDAAQSVARSSLNLALIEAAQRMDDGETRQTWPEQAFSGGEGLSVAPTTGRSATIKAKRPDTLLRLPSNSYRTEATITPPLSGSPVAQTTPGVGHGGVRNGVREHNPWDMTAIADSIVGDATDDAMSAEQSGLKTNRGDAGEGALPVEALTFAHRFDRVKQRTDSNDSVDPPHSVVSSDSWRSLLPEDDPYFIPDPSTTSLFLTPHSNSSSQ